MNCSAEELRQFQKRITVGRKRCTFKGKGYSSLPSCKSKVKKVKVFVAQSCLTFCKPLDSRLSDSSIRGILQARILE